MGLRTLTLNKQIYQELLKQIQNQLQPGDPLPTEKELQELYGVSRAPVRQALGRLETEGYIQRTPGRGTVVAVRTNFPQVNLSGFAHFYNERADRIKSRTLSMETVPADLEVAAHFGLEPGTQVLRVNRVRMVEEQVTACMHNYFTMPDINAALPDSGTEYFSLQQFIWQNLQREEVEVQEDLVATLVTPELAGVMELEPGTPVLFVTRRGWDEDHSPVEISRYWARTDITSYRTFLTNKQVGG